MSDERETEDRTGEWRELCQRVFEHNPDGRRLMELMFVRFGVLQPRTTLTGGTDQVGGTADPIYSAYRDGQASVPLGILQMLSRPVETLVEAITDREGD